MDAPIYIETENTPCDTHTHIQMMFERSKQKRSWKKTNNEAGIVFVPNGSIGLPFPWFLHLTCLLTSLSILSLVLSVVHLHPFCYHFLSS